MLKQCPRCGLLKEFYKTGGYCKSCNSEYNRSPDQKARKANWFKNNQKRLTEKSRLYMRTYRKEQRIK